MIAKHYCNLGRKVVVVEPNDLLAAQTLQKLAVVDYSISVTSIERFYEEAYPGEIVILNEYDLIVNQSSYLLSDTSAKGLWTFRDRQVIAFTATSSPSIERLISNTITPPVLLKFKSEYELVHAVSPVSDPTILTFVQHPALLIKLLSDIDNHFEKQPVIMIAEGEIREAVINHLKTSKFKYAQGGDQQTLAEVRSWEYGLLILNRDEGRGVDSRFKRDAMVLMTTEVSDYHEVQQMIGRSSRTRGICQGILYVIS